MTLAAPRPPPAAPRASSPAARPTVPPGSAPGAGADATCRATRAAQAAAAGGRPGRTVTPFRDADEAWFWTMAALMARRDGARYSANQGRTQRPCEPDDVLKCLDKLYRHRRSDLVNARILSLWGERQVAPNPAHGNERCDWRLWREALDRLEWSLRVKGIVA